MPPTPIIGDFTAFAVSQTSRKVIGFIDGPDRPPVWFPRQDFPVQGSIAMAGKVFATVRALAPTFSAARAISPMSATIGESLTHSGRLAAAFRAAPTTSATMPGSPPNCAPPFLTLGQEMF